MSNKLKPCAFCGSQADLDQFDGVTGNPVWAVECSECLIRHPGCATKKQAIEQWNNRVGEDKLLKIIEKLEKALQQIKNSPLTPISCDCGNGETLDDCQCIAIKALTNDPLKNNTENGYLYDELTAKRKSRF